MSKFPTNYSKFKARFNPKRTDDLAEDAKEHVGKILEFTYAWTHETGPYAGQAVFIPRDVLMGWVPECDLEPIDVG